MKANCIITLFIAILPFWFQDAEKKDWHTILPLKTTRSDVKKMFGKPLFDEGKLIDIYDVDEGRLNVMYTRKPCQQGLPANWGNWNVPIDTVVNVTIHLKKEVLFSDLKIPDADKLRWYTDDTLTTYYHDKKNGIMYSVRENGIVSAIEYGPKESDSHLLCNKNAPKIKY